MILVGIVDKLNRLIYNVAWFTKVSSVILKISIDHLTSDSAEQKYYKLILGFKNYDAIIIEVRKGKVKFLTSSEIFNWVP